MNCLGSWRAEWCWLQSPPLSCYMTEVLKNILQRLTIALLLHRISHIAHCVCILTKALLFFILLLKMAYVELMIGESRSMHLCHIYCKNQTMDPCRWQILQVDQDCARVWKVDGGNEIFLLWISLPFIWIIRGHGYTIIDIFFTWTFMCPNFFSTLGSWCVPIFFGSCFLGMPSFFLIAHASFERY